MILVPFVGHLIRKSLSGRADGAPQICYFRGEDYGVRTSSFSFYSGKNRLYGERYFSHDGPYPAVIVFFHGIGAGHRAYSQEISALAKQGYLVYAYDNTGSMMSEGKAIGNISQACVDQSHFFAFLDHDPLAQGLPRYAIGHSWGGYAALTALLPEYHVEKVVSLAGFSSPYAAMAMSSPAVKKVKRSVLLYQKFAFGKYGNLDGTDLMENTKAKVLYIQDARDLTCKTEYCYDHFKTHVHNPNVSFLQTKGKGHQPYWTEESVKYYAELKKHHIFEFSRNVNEVVDYKRLNQDDPKIMQAIFDFFKKE